MNFVVIFLTGLTTGGLTCLAVQGGLLATTLARQISVASPTSITQRKAQGQSGSRTASYQTITGIQLAQNLWPVVYFMAAKLLAYTFLGFLLGALGSVIQITPVVRSAMQMLAGLFMLATAFNMLNVHPIFRYVVIQPPKVLTRLVRNQAKSQEVFAPLVLGLMTILIPCGTTQAMEVLAITSGSPILGAFVMFVFVLGTSPTFLVLGFLATRIRGKYQPLFGTAAALAILFVGLVSLDGGLNLIGSPLAPSRILASISQPRGLHSSTDIAKANIVDGVQEVTINAENNGYFPNYVSAQKEQPIRIKLLTNNIYGCTRAFVIPSMGIQEVLPETGEQVINLPPQSAGTIYFTCGMGMYNGAIVIE
ncbi:MAG: sulfite exporter TauE/SafE family protein [Chloroflexi bacterium]|nr:sulfite exporter TauE/SafE family protein [Chloroflexota bacterium]